MTVFRPFQLPVQVSEDVWKLTTLCDGLRTAGEVIESFPGEKRFARENLERLYSLGIIRARNDSSAPRPLLSGRALAAP